MSWEDWINNRVTLSELDICRHYIKRDRLTRKTNAREAVYRRYFWFYWLASNTAMTREEIGKMFGGFNHSTVTHGVKSWKDLEKYPDVQEMTKDYKLSLETNEI